MKGEREVGGLWCSEVLALLYDYLDDELHSAERSRVEAHLSGCSVCAGFGGEAGAVAQAVRTQLAHPDPVSGEVEAKLLGLMDGVAKD